MTIFTLVGKRSGKWEFIAVGEDYKAYKTKFQALTERNEGFETVVLMDGNMGILKKKNMKPDILQENETPKKFGHKK